MLKLLSSKLHWPQVVALAVIVTGVVAFFALTPPAVLARIPWEAIVALLVAGGGSVAGGFLDRAVKRDPERRDRASDPTEIS